MKLVAQQGDRVFLLSVGKDMARVLDLDQEKLFPAYNLHSILARGYWEDPTLPLEHVSNLLEQVTIMDDYEPDTYCMRATMFDIDSHDKLATIDCCNGKIRMWENCDPNCRPTVNPGLPEDYFDHIENWTQLVPPKVIYRRKEYTWKDGDEFLFALVDQQPSNIIWFVASPDTWKIEAHKEWRERHREPWEL